MGICATHVDDTLHAGKMEYSADCKHTEKGSHVNLGSGILQTLLDWLFVTYIMGILSIKKNTSPD